MNKSVLTIIVVSLSAALSILFVFFSNPLPAAAFAVVAVGALFLRINSLCYENRTLSSQLEQQKKALEADRRTHLEEIKKMREATRDSLEDFRSVLSHQIRLPLSIVQGYAELLARNMVEDDDAKQTYLDKIVEHCSYISKVLSDQLSANRSFEVINPVFNRVDIVGFIRQTGEEMRALALSHGIQIQTLSTQDSLYIDADAVQLNKIFYNILENSIKYMGREGLITIYTDCDDGYLCITITDNGLGLSSEETSHIFEYSYQGSNKAGGSGHGLFLVKKAVEAHFGTISAASSIGMGMSIRISLPINQTEVHSIQQLDDLTF